MRKQRRHSDEEDLDGEDEESECAWEAEDVGQMRPESTPPFRRRPIVSRTVSSLASPHVCPRSPGVSYLAHPENVIEPMKSPLDRSFLDPVNVFAMENASLSGAEFAARNFSSEVR